VQGRYGHEPANDDAERNARACLGGRTGRLSFWWVSAVGSGVEPHAHRSTRCGCTNWQAATGRCARQSPVPQDTHGPRARRCSSFLNKRLNIFGSLILGSYAGWVFASQRIRQGGPALFSFGLTVLVILLGEILQEGDRRPLALPVSLASALRSAWP